MIYSPLSDSHALNITEHVLTIPQETELRLRVLSVGALLRNICCYSVICVMQHMLYCNLHIKPYTFLLFLNRKNEEGTFVRVKKKRSDDSQAPSDILWLHPGCDSGCPKHFDF